MEISSRLHHVKQIVNCVVTLPGQPFYSTQFRDGLWFLAKIKNADAERGFCDHPNSITPAIASHE